MNKAPAFQFYVQDFLVGTMLFNTVEIGAYILLLCHQWDNGFIEEDEVEIITRTAKKNLVRVLKKFEKTDKGLQNKRLEKTRSEQEEHRKIQSQKGRIGAEKRWGKKNSTGTKNDGTGISENGTGITPAIVRPLPGDSSSSSSSKNMLCKENIFNLMRGCTSRNTITDRQIREETATFIGKYTGQKITNLPALVNKWAGNIIPKEKKEVVI